jgi:maltose alpha-D-glucosyltransferase/alpha-amylase
MLRSLAHAVAAAKSELARFVPGATLVAATLREELVLFSQIFIQSYMEAARGSQIWIEDEGTRTRLLVLYLLAEMLHEIETGAESHPDWTDTAIDGVNAILDRMAKTA